MTHRYIHRRAREARLDVNQVGTEASKMAEEINDDLFPIAVFSVR